MQMFGKSSRSPLEWMETRLKVKEFLGRFTPIFFQLIIEALYLWASSLSKNLLWEPFLKISRKLVILYCHFQNVVCLFCAFNTARDMKNFVQISTIFLLFNKIKNLNQTLYISGNIESTKNADHFLEMPRLGELCDYYFKNHTC